MPIYAFACDACGHAFDRLQRLSDPDPVECPACGASGQVPAQLLYPRSREAGEGGEGAKPAAESKPEPKPAAAPAAKPEPAKPTGGSAPAG